MVCAFVCAWARYPCLNERFRFKSRYHPDENYKRRNEQNQNVVNRCEVFMDLMDKGWLNDVVAESDKANELVRFLDAVVIKLEGGSDQDVKTLLDGTPDVEELPAPAPDTKKEPIDVEEIEDLGTNGAAKTTETNGEHRHEAGSGSESGAYNTESESHSDDDDQAGKAKKRKRRSNKRKEAGAASDKKRLLHKTTSIFMRNLAPSVTKQDLEQVAKNYEGFKRVSLSDPAPERGFLRRGWITFESYVDVKKICWSLQNIKVCSSRQKYFYLRALFSSNSFKIS